MAIGTYALWLAGWIVLWGLVALVWFNVHWVRRAMRAYRALSPAERVLMHARRWRDRVGKPMADDLRRWHHDMRRRWHRGR